MSAAVDLFLEELWPFAPIKTTLYDLIEALNSEVEPQEEHLVIATVVYLLRSGRLTFPAGSAQFN